MNLVEYIIRFKEQNAKVFDKSQKNVEKLDRSVGKFNKKLSAGTIAAATAAAVAIGAFVGSSLKAFDTQQKALAQVRAGILSTGGTAGRSLQMLADQASDLQSKTIFGDEEILKGVTSQLLTFTNIAGEQFDRTQQAALDLATRLDGDLKSSSIQLGKALNDPIANLSALSRSGIQFTQSQKDTIKELQNTNQLAKAQSLILDELEKQYGGSAAAAAAAGTGGLKQLSNQFGDIKEVIGGALLPIFNAFASVAKGFFNFIQSNTGVFTTLVQTLGVMVAIVLVLVGAIKAWIVVQTIINVLFTANPIGIIIVLIGALIAGIITLYKNSETARGIFEGIFTVFRTIWNFLKAFFTPIFTKLGEVFRDVGDRIRKFLQKPIERARENFKRFLDLLEKIPGVGKLVRNLRTSFSEGFQKGVEDFRKEQEKAKLDAEVGVGAGSGTGTPGATPGAAGPQREQPGTVRSAAPKVFNINIENLVRQFQVNVSNSIQEGTEEVKTKITQALLEAVADVEVQR